LGVGVGFGVKAGEFDTDTADAVARRPQDAPLDLQCVLVAVLDADPPFAQIRNVDRHAIGLSRDGDHPLGVAGVAKRHLGWVKVEFDETGCRFFGRYAFFSRISNRASKEE
jgi:hypothetical protein